MSLKISKTEFKKDVMDNCRRLFRKELDEATPQEQYQSVSYAVKDMIVENGSQHRNSSQRMIQRLSTICPWSS